MGDAEELLRSDYGSVLAPAGCGKTELIVSLMGRMAERPTLVLTHTNAGVDALRRRLRARGVPGSRCHVTTIDSWALRYVSGYPVNAGRVDLDAPPSQRWPAVHEGARLLLNKRFVGAVVRASFGDVLVDEYQDCSIKQHQVILRLAELLPVRVFGDPMQGIFGFKDPVVDWVQDVESAFPPRLSMNTPWRWLRSGHNSALGSWVHQARTNLAQGAPVRVDDDGPVRWVEGHRDFEVVRRVAFEQAQGSTVVVCRTNTSCQALAGMTGGAFQTIENLEAPEGLQAAEEIAAAPRGEAARRICNAVRKCCSGFPDRLRDLRTSSDLEAERQLLLRAAESGTPEDISSAFDAVCRIKGLKAHRRELLWALRDALRAWAKDPGLPVATHFRHRRYRTSVMGRPMTGRDVGNPHLIKGMEFDHAVVVPEEMNARVLYVALSRASKSLTVVSRDRWLRPSEK